MPTPEAMKDVLGALTTESDITVVTVGAALVETALRMAIRARMLRTLSASDDKQLFEGEGGPLSTFSSKIRVAYAFEVIGDNLKAELTKMKDIRNAFAHAKSILSFDDDAVTSACSALTTPDIDTGAPWRVDGDEVIWSPDTPRDQFLVAVRLCWLFLYQEVHNPPRWVRA